MHQVVARAGLMVEHHHDVDLATAQRSVTSLNGIPTTRPMGNFYTNLTVRAASQAGVAQALGGRHAFVSPVADGNVVVFDAACERQDLGTLSALAQQLSSALDTTALAVLNHDDDVLCYLLFRSGVLRDSYDSSPGYFDAGAVPSPPAGGNTQELGEAFSVADAASLERVLRKSSLDEDGFVFAVQRHEALAALLGLPSCSIGAGYDTIESGDLPIGLTRSQLLETS